MNIAKGAKSDFSLSLDFHRGNPEVTLEEHERHLCLSLGESLSCKRLVYLDTKYWIILRDAANNVASDSKHTALLEVLRSKVVSGILLCPISASILLELMKQTDARARLATAALIDELSHGVCLIEEQQRINTEISYFLHAKGTAAMLHPLDHLVWCKVSYVLGIVHPQ